MAEERRILGYAARSATNGRPPTAGRSILGKRSPRSGLAEMGDEGIHEDEDHGDEQEGCEVDDPAEYHGASSYQS